MCKFFLGFYSVKTVMFWHVKRIFRKSEQYTSSSSSRLALVLVQYVFIAKIEMILLN